MREAQAKKHLRTMLRSFGPGGVLHLLADLYRETQSKASRINDAELHKRIEETLFVVGLGIDAAMPR